MFVKKSQDVKEITLTPGLSVRVPGCQKLQMIDLAWSVTRCFIKAVPIWLQWASKG